MRIYQSGKRMKRLDFVGSQSQYFRIWIKNLLLTLITMGVYYPWAKMNNYRYLYKNIRLYKKTFEYPAIRTGPLQWTIKSFINIHFAFNIKEDKLYLVDSLKQKHWIKIHLKTMLITYISLVLIIAMCLCLGITVNQLQSTLDTLININRFSGVEMIPIFILLLIILLGIIYIRAYQITRRYHSIFQNTTVDGKIGFMSSLRILPLIGVMLSNTLLLIATLGLAYSIAEMRILRLIVETTFVDVTEKGLEIYLLTQEKERYTKKEA